MKELVINKYTVKPVFEPGQTVCIKNKNYKVLYVEGTFEFTTGFEAVEVYYTISPSVTVGRNNQVFMESELIKLVEK